ncbi:hypothetical protein [Edaphobacter dinghuensis]|uniref:Uncharacterized protein n=1 Tax=Edaphobacter dinghuensis TaxID=1560005 RepID=A0A917HQ66_9BACT|nr:hypothetical protein [Edaphobacter dinghuensis]GGG86892.1 hypothetical protein GCM10011585_33590 [Edaphobacter dinghuensis]
MKSLSCEMRDDCLNAVTHIGNKGYIYCSVHALERRQSGYERTRRLRVWELKLLRNGDAVPSYTPIKKPRHAASQRRMTRQEALVEAQRRWGPQAEVHRYNGSPRFGQPTRYGVYRCSLLESATAQMGIGESWELAFSDADARHSRADAFPSIL